VSAVRHTSDHASEESQRRLPLGPNGQGLPRVGRQGASSAPGRSDPGKPSAPEALAHPPGQGLETRSLKRRRTYKRKFNHEAARHLLELGWSRDRVAEHFGVSYSAVARVSDERWRARMAIRNKEYAWRHRQPCAGGCGRLVWAHMQGRSGLCPACYGAQNVQGVAPDRLQCSRCQRWLPDHVFPRRKQAPQRRSRDYYCRVCARAVRQEHRERRKVPCLRCGAPCMHPADQGRQGKAGYRYHQLCAACYRAHHPGPPGAEPARPAPSAA
jgi:hypothetical protein